MFSNHRPETAVPAVSFVCLTKT